MAKDKHEESGCGPRFGPGPGLGSDPGSAPGGGRGPEKMFRDQEPDVV